MLCDLLIACDILSTGHAERAFGVVLLLSGGSNPKDSVFMCKNDAPYLDATRQPVHLAQKPLSLFSQLIDLYTGADDWILDGTGGIGKIMMVVTRVLSLRANM